LKERKERIYVAGPYCPKNCSLHDASRQAQRNVDKAIEITNAIFQKGQYAYCPHLSHYIHIHYSNKTDYGQVFWYNYDLSILKYWATSLYYIASSYGADLELKVAQELGLKIYRSMDEVPNV
jgi:hypothetical protein